jgi:tetratricopeptide (TPR) repeat protein
VAEPSRPTLDEISTVFAHLADRVAAERGRTLDAIIRLSIARAVVELEHHIPGLYEPPDAGAAAAMATASADALRRGRQRAALSRALRGLSFSPHHPELHYLAASACLQFGAAEEAVRLLQHALWIHPGYLPARQDLEALAAFHDDRGSIGDPDAGQSSSSRFELVDPEQGSLWAEEDLEGWEGRLTDMEGGAPEGEFPDDESEDRAA